MKKKKATPCQCKETETTSRRDFIKKSALGVSALTLPTLPVFAGPFAYDGNGHLVPEDKKLSAEWIKSLYERGVPEVFTASKNQLKYIGMPVGGIACGQLYLGGDGKLWLWHIFKVEYSREKDHGNRLDAMTLGGHYISPEKAFKRETRPVEQAAAIRLKYGGQTKILKLDSKNFNNISFRGEYPMGKITYQDDSLPVEIKLEAFSPFIPTSLEKSALPVTLMSYKVKNTTSETVEVDLAGGLENAVCPYAESNHLGIRRNTLVKTDNRLTIYSTAEALSRNTAKTAKADVVFEDFEGNSYKKWKTKGIAFGKEAVKKGTKGFGEQGVEGSYYVSSFNIRELDGKPNTSTYKWGRMTLADDFTGTLTSKKFTITHDYITFLIGGGYHPEQTAMSLIINGKTVRTATGHNSTRLRQEAFDVRDFGGKKAQLQIVDNHKGVWGNITIDHIVFTDKTPLYNELTDQHGYGSMSWSICNPTSSARAILNAKAGTPQDIFAAMDNDADKGTSATTAMNEKQVGALSESFKLQPGEEQEVTFMLTWYFPHLNRQEVEHGQMLGIKDIKYLKRHYANWFRSANQVADYVVDNFKELTETTRQWNKTYYNSTLPYWLLDRSFISINCMATNTLLWFDNGRIWGWEGVECCPGTCQHVWQYAQGMARIFPEAEKTLREVTDLGYSFKEDGGFGHRDETAGGHGKVVAHDGHCGTIMRMYREHKTSKDYRFLKQYYGRIKRAVQFIIKEDKDKDGLLEGGQHNTLDAKWYGPMGWISSLYLGAVAAGKEMALEVGDTTFANTCNEILQKGRKNIVEKLFNGEYFIHQHDREKHPNVISSNDGCHIDQVLGQSFAGQIGLPERVVPKKETVSALESIWKYNFAPNAFDYQLKHKVIKGVRIYATEGEAGTIMTTWPKSDGDTWAVPGMVDRPDASTRWQGPGGYFDECMNGFEYQVAFHMIQEGLLEKGLAVARAVHDRYNANIRNPYNEIECSDHYSRSMASYGVFLAVCGFDYHGPKGHLTFNPQLTPEDFKAPFTVAEGWGSFTQTRKTGVQENTLQLQYGQLNLNQLTLQLPENANPVSSILKVNDKKVEAMASAEKDGQYVWKFQQQLEAGDVLQSIISL